MTAKNVSHKRLARHLTGGDYVEESNGMTVKQRTAIAGEPISKDSRCIANQMNAENED